MMLQQRGPSVSRAHRPLGVPALTTKSTSSSSTRRRLVATTPRQAAPPAAPRAATGEHQHSRAAPATTARVGPCRVLRLFPHPQPPYPAAARAPPVDAPPAAPAAAAAAQAPATPPAPQEGPQPVAETFDWHRQWWPLSVEEYLKTDRPQVGGDAARSRAGGP
jgi:hypothetical protein